MRLKIKWILLILWCCLIFYFSHQPGSDSSRLSGYFVSLFPSTWLIDVSFVIRKTAHFIEYFLLGIITLSLFHEYQRTVLHAFLLSLLFCFLFSITDEVHQLFILGRTGRVLDVFIDTVGAFVGIFFFSLLSRYKRL